MSRIAFLALLLSFPVSGLAQWSAEVPLSVSTMGPAALGQNSPAAASDGESWYAAWAHVTDANETQIVGLHLRSDGSLAAPLPTLLSDGSKEEYPTVIWNGSRYLVIWRSNYTEFKGQWLSREGERIGGVVSLMVGSLLGEPDAATNGQEILITGGLYGGGVILRPDGSTLLLSDEKFGFSLRGVASDGESFLVYGRVPVMGDALGWARVSASGSILTTQKGIPLFGTDVVWTGTEYVIAGQSTPGPASYPTLVRISREGEPVGEPIQVSTDRTHSRVSIAPSGNGRLLAAWTVYVDTQDGPTRVGSIAPGGQVSILPRTVEGSGSHLASANGSVLMLWTSPDAIRHQRLSSTGAPLDEARVTSLSARDQTRPAVAATSAGFLAAWEERSELGFMESGFPRVVVGPLRPRPSSLRTAVAQSENEQTAPAIASSGDVALVAWLQFQYPGRDHAMVQRYSATGAPLDTDAIDLGELAVPPSQTASRLAAFWSGKYFLVAWSAEGGLHYKRVTREGVVLDAEPMLVPHSERTSGSTNPAQVEPHFAAAGDRILLVWQSSVRTTGGCVILCPAPPPSPRIEFVRLDREGMLLDPVPIVISSGVGWGQVFPRVASNGDAFLVVWEDFERLEGLVVSRDGVVETRAGFVVDGSAEGLIATGADYFLLTRRDGNRLIGYPVSADGSLKSPAMSFGTVWSGSPTDPSPSTAMAIRDDGAFVVLFTRWEESLGAVRRIVYRHLGSPPEPRRRIVGERSGKSSASTRIR